MYNKTTLRPVHQVRKSMNLYDHPQSPSHKCPLFTVLLPGHEQCIFINNSLFVYDVGVPLQLCRRDRRFLFYPRAPLLYLIL